MFLDKLAPYSTTVGPLKQRDHAGGVVKKQPNSGIPPKPRPDLREEILDDLEHVHPGAIRAFDKLARKGVDADKLRSWLEITFVQLVLNPDRVRREAPKKEIAERHLYVRRVPTRIWQMADKVERIINTMMSPLPVKFLVLPEHLRGYAAFIEERLRAEAQVVGDPEWVYQKSLQIWFVDFVHTETGHYYYEEVATLLAAVFRLAKVDRSIDAQTLKMLYRRNPHIRLRGIDALRAIDALAKQPKPAKPKVGRKK